MNENKKAKRSAKCCQLKRACRSLSLRPLIVNFVFLSKTSHLQDGANNDPKGKAWKNPGKLQMKTQDAKFQNSQACSLRQENIKGFVHQVYIKHLTTRTEGWRWSQGQTQKYLGRGSLENSTYQNPELWAM